MAHGFAVWGGPIATIIASLTAAAVAIRFGFVQAEIARAQRDIAYDKLKLDLYVKRYPIFDLCDRAIQRLTSPPPPDVSVDPLAGLIEEFERVQARFLFSGQTLDYIFEVEQCLNEINWTFHMREVAGSSEEDVVEEKKKIYDRAFDLEDRLGGAFEHELGFGNLREIINDVHLRERSASSQMVKSKVKTLLRKSMMVQLFGSD